MSRAKLFVKYNTAVRTIRLLQSSKLANTMRLTEQFALPKNAHKKAPHYGEAFENHLRK